MLLSVDGDGDGRKAKEQRRERRLSWWWILTGLGEGIGAHRSASSCRAPRRICRHPSVGLLRCTRMKKGDGKREVSTSFQAIVNKRGLQRSTPRNQTSLSGSHGEDATTTRGVWLNEGTKRPQKRSELRVSLAMWWMLVLAMMLRCAFVSRCYHPDPPIILHCIMSVVPYICSCSFVWMMIASVRAM